MFLEAFEALRVRRDDPPPVEGGSHAAKWSLEDRLELDKMRLALSNAEVSGPGLVLATIVSSLLAFKVEHYLLGVILFVLGSVSTAFRYLLCIRGKAMSDAHMFPRIGKLTRLLEINASVSATMWFVGCAFLLPRLDAASGTAYLLMVAGSISSAAMFMYMAGRSFHILAIVQLLSVMFAPALRSVPLLSVPMILVFGAMMFKAARTFSDMAVKSLRASLIADEARRAAEEMNAAKSRFLATISHELRTPLYGVTASAKSLLREGISERDAALVSTIQTSSAHLLGLLEEALEYVRGDAGELRIERVPVLIESCVRDAVELLRPAAQQKALRLQFVSDLPPDLVIRSDVRRIHQIIYNLVGNALKFTRKGDVSVWLTMDDGQLVLAISDSGPGIPPEIMERLFQPFTRGKETDWQRVDGLGLGLSISWNLCRALGGDIKCQSRVGEGTTFTVKLPIEAASIEDVDRERNAAVGAFVHKAATGLAVPEMWASTRNTTPADLQAAPMSADVLVIDDAEINRLVAKRILLDAKHRVELAATAAEGLLALACARYRVVLLDLEMPIMSGLELIEAFRRVAPARPEPVWVMLTGHVMAKARQGATEMGVSAFLTKPIEPNLLLSTLDDAIERSGGAAKDQLLERRRLEAHAEDSIEFLGDMVSMYKRDSSRRIETIERAVAAGDAQTVRQTAHALGGIAAEIGDLKTTRVAKQWVAMFNAAAQEKVQDGPAGPSPNEVVLAAIGAGLQECKQDLAVAIESLEFFVSAKELEESRRVM